MEAGYEFFVEGRYFPDTLLAFTFAGIQADRMNRPVEVHLNEPKFGTGRPWHCTAQPSNYVRSHLTPGVYK